MNLITSQRKPHQMEGRRSITQGLGNHPKWSSRVSHLQGEKFAAEFIRKFFVAQRFINIVNISFV